MKDAEAPLIKTEDPRIFTLVVVSDDRSAASSLFPITDARLSHFQNIISISSFSELLNIYLSNKAQKLVVFVDVTSRQPLLELKKIIYGAHAEARGLLFAFSAGELTDEDFERLIAVGFDDAFELQKNDGRKSARIYSWIRRFGAAPVSEEFAERDRIAFLSNQRDKRIGNWTILVNEMVARDDIGKRVKLTRQEIDFLYLLFDSADSARDSSYTKLFKAPHAIVHKLKKKLGSNLPIRHDSGGRYHLVGGAEDKTAG